jgi:DNA-directed RNA polymerase specialized sigma24 family protein
MGKPYGIIPVYTSDETLDALRLLVAEQPDEDSERRADLELALRTLPTDERDAAIMYASGYTMREISTAIENREAPSMASRLVGRSLTNLRARMNSIERGN